MGCFLVYLLGTYFPSYGWAWSIPLCLCSYWEQLLCQGLGEKRSQLMHGNSVKSKEGSQTTFLDKRKWRMAPYRFLMRFLLNGRRMGLCLLVMMGNIYFSQGKLSGSYVDTVMKWVHHVLGLIKSQIQGGFIMHRGTLNIVSWAMECPPNGLPFPDKMPVLFWSFGYSKPDSHWNNYYFCCYFT